MNTKVGFFLMILVLILVGCKKDPIETGTLTDARDGHNYQWVKIGDQIWMAENLAYLPSVNKSIKESKTLPYYYVYGYEGESVDAALTTDNYAVYGVLYNWPAAQTACPTFWHLPTNEEWTTLITYLGEGLAAGKKMKETGTTHWEGSNSGATNESGFTAIPGGVRSLSYGFLSLHELAQFWTATENAESEDLVAWYWVLPTNDYAQIQSAYTSMGNSIRCVKD